MKFEDLRPGDFQATSVDGGLAKLVRIWEHLRDLNTGGYGGRPGSGSGSSAGASGAAGGTGGGAGGGTSSIPPCAAEPPFNELCD